MNPESENPHNLWIEKLSGRLEVTINPPAPRL